MKDFLVTMAAAMAVGVGVLIGLPLCIVLFIRWVEFLHGVFW